MNAIEFIVLLFIVGGFGLVGLVGIANDVHCTYKDFRIKLNKIKRNINLRIKVWRAMR